MECSCEIEVDCYDAQPTSFESFSKMARKRYRCTECSRTIMAGESYRWERGQWEGKRTTYRTCSDCLSIRDIFFQRWVYGEIIDALWDFIYDQDGDIPESRISRLTPAARARVCGIIEAYWDKEEDEEDEPQWTVWEKGG